MVFVSAEHNIPDGQSLYVPSFPTDLSYDASAKLVKWEGQLNPGQVLTYVWESRLLFDQDESDNPTVTFSLDEWGLIFERFAPFYGSNPELSGSKWLSPAHTNLQTQSGVTLTFLLQNGSDFAGDIQASVWMMEGLSPITATSPMTEMPHGWYLPWWTGDLDARDVYTLTLPVFAWAKKGPVRVDALMHDERDNRWEFPLWLNVLPRSFYLPLITR
jgi:hypothetical protein